MSLRISKSFATWLFMTAALVVSGCDFRPLYGTSESGGQIAGQLAAVSVDQQHDRLGQLIRNEIVSGISPAGTSTGDAYRLELSSEDDEFKSIDATNTEPLRLQYKVNASFTLYDNQTGKAVHSGKTFAQASYDRVDAPAANLQALTNAQERAAREVGQDIRVRLAAYFSSNGNN